MMSIFFLTRSIVECYNTLHQHTSHANYQSCVWKLFAEVNVNVPSPKRKGWKIVNGDISIVWMPCQHAPQAVQ